MKFIKLIFLLLVFVGCSNDKKNSVDGVEQWLSFDGERRMPHVVLVSGDE